MCFANWYNSRWVVAMNHPSKTSEDTPRKITERYKRKMFRDKIFYDVLLRKYIEQRKRKKRVFRSVPFDILNATINHYRAKGGADRPRFMILLLSRCPRKQTRRPLQSRYSPPASYCIAEETMAQENIRPTERARKRGTSGLAIYRRYNKDGSL